MKVNKSAASNGINPLAVLQPSSQGGDPDGGADRAQEISRGNSPAAVVQISDLARQALAASREQDADGGLDGK